MYINVYNIYYMYENDVLPSSRIEMEHIKWNQISYVWSWVIVIVQDCGHASPESANKRDASNFEPLKSSKVHEKAGQYPFAGRITWWPTHFIDLHGSTAPLGPLSSTPPFLCPHQDASHSRASSRSSCARSSSTLFLSPWQDIFGAGEAGDFMAAKTRHTGTWDHRKVHGQENMSWSPGEIHMDLEQKWSLVFLATEPNFLSFIWAAGIFLVFSSWMLWCETCNTVCKCCASETIMVTIPRWHVGTDLWDMNPHNSVWGYQWITVTPWLHGPKLKYPKAQSQGLILPTPLACTLITSIL